MYVINVIGAISVSERRLTMARGWQIMCWADVKLTSAQPRVRRLCGENLGLHNITWAGKELFLTSPGVW